MRFAFCTALACLLSGAAMAGDYDGDAVKLRPIAKTAATITGQKVEVNPHPEVRATLLELAPGATIALHKHPYQRMAYILEGEVSVKFKDLDKIVESRTGDFIVEARDQWHEGINRGDTPAKLLVIDLVPVGTNSNMIKH